MNKIQKIEEIMDIVKGHELELNIPFDMWLTDLAEVARRLNAAARKLGFEAHFTPNEVKRFKD